MRWNDLQHDKSSFASPYCSVESLTSSNSSGKRNASRRERNYNVSIFRGLKNSGEKPTADDVKDTRRECQMFFNERVSLEEKRQTISDAIATIDQLASFLRPAESEDDVLFLTEYQAFICWVYTQIRFGNFSTNMAKHFVEVKKRHLGIFECLRAKRFRVARLMSILRFSHVCLEYAEVCDEEAVGWCRRAMENAQETRRRTSSRLSDSLQKSESPDEISHRRNARRISEIIDFLSANLTQIELVWTLKIHIGTNTGGTEKLV